MTARALLTALALLAALACGGCSGGFEGTGDKGFVGGNGQVVTYAVDERAEAVDISGEDLDGDPLDIADYRGEVVVLVVWAAWCPPCRAEAPEVVEAAKQTAGVAQFVGINLSDSSPATERAFVRAKGIPYPSLFDPDGKSLVDFPGALGPNSIPGFAVLDAEGRVSAAINGELPSVLTLTELVKDAARG